MKFCILISAFCVLTSVGFGLDVSVDTILAPSGTPDSGQSMFPRVVVSNRSDQQAMDASTWLTSDDGTPSGYSDSVTHFDMLPLSTETLSYSIWIPRGRDSMTATAWIHCDGDTYPQNDTFRLRFFVRIKDIGLSDLWPAGDTFDSGQIIVPNVRASNLGNMTMSFVLWGDSITLLPGEDTVAYGDSLTCMPGIWAIQAFLVIIGDMFPENNIIVDTFYVRSGSAIEENAANGSWPSHSDKLQPTVLRRLPAGAVAFDAMGRRVVDPKPGVYFVREEPQASSHKPQTMRKVILGR
jgi:hypothetical protein